MASPKDKEIGDGSKLNPELEETFKRSNLNAELEARLATLERHLADAENKDHPPAEKKKDFSALVLTILGAIGTGLFAIANSFLQARQAHQLEQDKLQSTIILKAIEPSDPEERKKALLFYLDVGLLVDPNGKIAKLKPENIPQATQGKILTKIGYSDVVSLGEAVVFSAGMAINPAGAPRAYHPDGHSGLDYLTNSGHPGDWWGLVTDDGTPSGNPIIQGPKDPAPGFYVSPTSLQDQSRDRTDPRRYVDSSTVPYITMPGHFTIQTGVQLGDIAAAIDERTEKLAFGVVADIGPVKRIGEGSIALAAALGVSANPQRGGVDNGITYVVFPQSGQHWPITVDEIRRTGEKLFEKWGGLKRLKAQNRSPMLGPSPQVNEAAAREKKVASFPVTSPAKTEAILSDDIESKLRDIVVEQLGVNPEQVVPSANFSTDLGADSLHSVELIMAVEEEFNIEIADEDAERIHTFADACAYIRAHEKQH